MATDKPNMDFLWASEGDVIDPGNEKVAQGWTEEIPPHEWENWVQNRQDTMLAHINERGIPQWDSSTEYLANRSYVTGSSGTIFRCLQDNSDQNPETDTLGYWEAWDSGIQDALALKADKATTITAGTGLTGGGNLSANRTLNVQYGSTAGTAAQGNDSRLSNSREWTANTVSQSEAEAGTATTRRAWTAQRVRQAIAAWWNSVSGSFGRTIVGRTNASQVRNDLGLGTAATQNVGELGSTSQTDLIRLYDAMLYYGDTSDTPYDDVGVENRSFTFFHSTGGAPSDAPTSFQTSVLHLGNNWGRAQLAINNNSEMFFRAGTSLSWNEVYHSGNTGSMVTRDAGTGSSQFRTNAQNDARFAQGDDFNSSGNYANLRARGTTAADVGAPPTSRTISAGTGLTGGGNLSANRTISLASSERMTTSNVLSAIAGASVGSVGTYAYLFRGVGTSNPGSTLSGSALEYSGSGAAEIGGGGSSPSGTWRCMGFQTTLARSTTWLRVS